MREAARDELIRNIQVMEDLRDDIATLRRQLAASEAREARLREALEPFAFGSATMEEIIWRGLPDTASGTITVQLCHFRNARAALAASDAGEDGR